MNGLRHHHPDPLIAEALAAMGPEAAARYAEQRRRNLEARIARAEGGRRAAREPRDPLSLLREAQRALRRAEAALGAVRPACRLRLACARAAEEASDWLDAARARAAGRRPPRLPPPPRPARRRRRGPPPGQLLLFDLR